MENKREKIEQKIEEIVEYLDACKLKPFSNNIILVNKDEIDSYIHDLKKCAPDEIKRYQKIIANREAIIAEAEKIRNDAKLEAQEVVNRTIQEMNSYVNEDNITQSAYIQAQEIIDMAAAQAQETLDNAAIEANRYKAEATQYVDSLLAHIENLCSTYIDSTFGHFNNLIGGLNTCKETVQANRAELYPPVEEAAVAVSENTTDFIPVQPATPQDATSDLADLELL